MRSRNDQRRLLSRTRVPKQMSVQLAIFIFIFGCGLLNSWLRPRVHSEEYASTFASMTLLGLVSGMSIAFFYVYLEESTSPVNQRYKNIYIEWATLCASSVCNSDAGGRQ